MERKGGSTAVVTAEEVTTALAKTRVGVDEERVLRMRYGATVPRERALPSAAEDNQELGDELLLIEMQLFRAIKAQKKAPATRNASKDKIVRALRKK